MSNWLIGVLIWLAIIALTWMFFAGADEPEEERVMDQDAVKRAVQGATRQAFTMGLQAAKCRSSEREAHQRQAVTYAEELVLPMVNLALDQVREERWIEDHGKRQSAPDVTL